MKKIFVGLILSVSTMSTFAGDAKLFPGSNCSAIDGSQEGYLERLDGTIKNIGSSAVDVTCPMLNDITSDGTINSSYVNLVPNGIDSIDCDLYIVNPNGQWSRSPKSAYNTGTPTTLTFSSNLSAGGPSKNRYFFECKLDPQAEITQYYYTE